MFFSQTLFLVTNSAREYVINQSLLSFTSFLMQDSVCAYVCQCVVLKNTNCL